MERIWWKEAVGYQIYPRSFKDSNNDGIGDIRGIISKLDYLKELGIDVIWICPMYKSPNDDNGYDISDYQDIMDDFGNMEDFDLMLDEVHKRGMKLIIDLVINHTSDEHPWFIESKLSKDSKKRDWYIWRDGKDGAEPNNWESIFKGSAWQYDENTEQYFLHLFSKRQPDLNWDNEEVRQEIYQMINWWLDKGIAGFRVDAINFIKKDQRYQDGEPDGEDGLVSCIPFARNQPGIEVFCKELKENTFAKHDCMTISEAYGVSYDKLGIYIGENGCFDSMFDFNYSNFDIGDNEEWFIRKDWTAKQFRDLLFTSQVEVNKVGWVGTFLENHDQPRSLDKLIVNKADHGYYSATMIASMYFFLRGVPYIYQGEELGMANCVRRSIDDFDDISSHGQYQRMLEEGFSESEALALVNKRSRDNSRTPMPFDDSQYAGFSDVEPWLALNESYPVINVKAQFNDPDSVYSFYKKMIYLRQQSVYSNTLTFGSFIPDECENDNLIVYQRSYQGQLIVNVCNFSNQEQPFICAKELILNNYKEYDGKVLKPYQTIMYLEENK